MGPRARLDGCEKSRPNGNRSAYRSAWSESLYRLSYSGPMKLYIYIHTHICAVEAGYNDNGLTDTSYITTDVTW